MTVGRNVAVKDGVDLPLPHHSARRRRRPKPERRLRQPFTSSGARSRTQSQRIGIFDPYRLLTSRKEPPSLCLRRTTRPAPHLLFGPGAS